MADHVELPNDHQAERMLIATCLRSRDEFDDVAGWLKADEFFSAYTSFIWQAMLALSAAGSEFSISTIHDWLRRNDKAMDVSVGMLIELQTLFSGGSAMAHANLIRQAHLRRLLMETARSIFTEASQPGPESADPIDSAERQIFAISERSTKASEPAPLAEVVRNALVELDDRKSGKRPGLLPSGYRQLDGLIGGFEDGSFVIVAARPSIGKTAFAINLLARMCSYGPVLCHSLEQSKQELAERLLSRESGVDSYRIKTGRTTAADDNAIAFASQRLCAMPWFVDDAGSQTATSIASAARRFKRRHGIRSVLIDYLQLIEPEDRRIPRNEQVQILTRRMKFMGRETGVPIICLAQCNRELESRPDKRPRLSDLRESGAIEQDADMVLMLHVDPQCPNVLEVIVAKHRNGTIGTVLMEFEKTTMRITEKPFSPSAPPGGAEWMK